MSEDSRQALVSLSTDISPLCSEGSIYAWDWLYTKVALSVRGSERLIVAEQFTTEIGARKIESVKRTVEDKR